MNVKCVSSLLSPFPANDRVRMINYLTFVITCYQPPPPDMSVESPLN